jgi:cytochrome c-type biogenesis protein
MLLFDGSQVNFLIAFLGGVITFFASCLLPLVPTYLAYLAGIATTNQPASSKTKLYRREIFINGLIFTLGFIAVFVLLGAGSSSLGLLLGRHKLLFQRLGGAFFVLLGLFMLGIFRPAFLYRERKFSLPVKPTRFRQLNSLLVGLVFGFAWTPCIGPVLAVILFWASQATTVAIGTSLLLAYGIGLGIPFLIIALFFEKLAPLLKKTQPLGQKLHWLAAIVIIVMGILLAIGRVELVSVRLLQWLNFNTLAV